MIPGGAPTVLLVTLLAGLVSPVVGLGAQEPSPAPPEPPALEAIEGRVVQEADGAAVEEAWVEVLTADGRVVRRTVTDSAGAFRVVLPGPGSWRLRVSRRDFRAVVTEPLEVAGGGTVPVEVTLSPRAASSPPSR